MGKFSLAIHLPYNGSSHKSSPLQWFLSQIKLYLSHPHENSTKHLTLLPVQLTYPTWARILLIYVMPRPAADYEIS